MSFDPYVNITTKDASGVKLAELPMSTTLQALTPIFAPAGLDNKCQTFGTLSSFLNEYSDDVLNLDLYGQQGLNAKQILTGGGMVHACRLMPSDAKAASIILQVHVKTVTNIPVYQRNDFGSFLLDEQGNKIPLKEEIENEEGEKETVTVVKDGFTVKLVAVEATNTNMDEVVRSSQDGQWKIYPLVKFYALTRGKCGNNIGFTILNDFKRDKQVADGRRYELQFYKSNSKGVISTYLDSYFFSFNPEALLSADSEQSEALQMQYDNLDPDNYYEARPIQMDYYYKNYQSLVELLHTKVDADNDWDIDFLTCRDKEINDYDNLYLDGDSIDMRERVIFFLGGHDGSLQLGNVVQGKEGEITVDEDLIKDTKKELLKSFFKGDIDEELKDCRLVPCGVIFDADYDISIKTSMANDLPSIREDIFVFLDCNHPTTYQEAIRTANDIRSRLDTSLPQHAIYPHCGICVNQTKRYKVTQTYEMAYMYASVYKTHPYRIVSGFETGRIKTFLPSFTIQGETQIDRIENAQLNYITKLSNTGNTTGANGLRPLYVMAEDTQYNAPLGNSVFLSIRNALVVSDLKRLTRTILPKYSFKEDASEAMSNANLELRNNISTRYPSTIIFEIEFLQTDRDKILETCTVNIVVRFPGIIKTWNVTITAKRVGID